VGSHGGFHVPTACWAIWAGPRRGQPRGALSGRALRALRLAGVPPRLGQDGRDAIAPALTALDYDRGRTRSIGDIVIPARPQERSMMKIDGDRLQRSIEELGRIGETPRGGLTRLALSDEDRRGRDWMVGLMREAGLRVAIDQMGNTSASARGPRRSRQS
jgi:hypothetical protein